MRRWSAIAGLLWMTACGQPDSADPPVSPAAAELNRASACPTAAVHTTALPGTEPRHTTAAFWIDRLPPGGADQVLVPSEAIAGLNAQFSKVVGAWRSIDDSVIGDRETINASIAERMAYLKTEVDAGRFVEAQADAFAVAESVVAAATAVDHQRLVVDETPLRCIPLTDGLFKVPVDRDFDRNACASLHPGERVRVLARGPKGRWLYVHAGHTVGWVENAVFSKRLSPSAIDAWTGPKRLVPVRDDVTTRGGVRVRLGVSLPLLSKTQEGDYSVLVPGLQGPMEDVVASDAAVSEGHEPLTRRTLLEAVFSELGDPYGWGGRAGERDCSRLVRDVLGTFGFELARHSGVQAKLGVRNVDVSELEPQAKRAAIREAAEGGVVVLYMKGHIMLYVGADGARDYAISAMSEYLMPCEGGPDTTHRVDAVAVSTLALGENTGRTAFIERIRTLVVFEPPTAG
ncbi:MAG: SH3 domain-containing protein [Nannocystaceae bacterium]|nr:SH3 domain-containing protein [Nannocystaceae bacterium]